MSGSELRGWDRLRHGGLMLDPARTRVIARNGPKPVAPYHADILRRMLSQLAGQKNADATSFITFVLEVICGFGIGSGTWLRGSQVGAEWSRKAITGESVRPRQLWIGTTGGSLPVFFDDAPRLAIGNGRRATSQVLQWLRAGSERIALLTNGRQWRLMFAGLDFDSWCEWDTDLWLEEGELGAQIDALRTLLAPQQFTPPEAGAQPPLLSAILDSRKGQAELSAALGERVREAVELLVQSHDSALSSHCDNVHPADIYRAAVRVVMRMVVVLFAESRDLLPRDNALYNSTYGLGGLLTDLERAGARGGNRLKRQFTAWPRILAMYRLVHDGSHHPALPVPAYGGDLFAPAPSDAVDGLERALRVFESACFDGEIVSDQDVYLLLEKLTRTRIKVRQGRAAMWVSAPVDFSDLSSEYIGILYEGLLDFELRTAPSGDPIIFLSVGNQPALPLSRLEAMEDSALVELLEKMKDTSKASDDAGAEGQPEEQTSELDADEEADDESTNVESNLEAETEVDERHLTRSRAELWARRAAIAGKLVPKLRGDATVEKRAAHEAQVARKAKQLVTRVVLPGERFLVRWGGTRKGSGTFYTRPGLAVPLIQRTLRPLAWNAPVNSEGYADVDAPQSLWSPKAPEEILALTICDPACGSGTFPVGALRYLTDALYASLHFHGRISLLGDQALVRMLNGSDAASPDEGLSDERLPCRPDDPTFEVRLKAVLRRHVVERCIYGVDLDPLAVELCRLALWIETMDRSLPFSFLDHKIKCGNGLIGAWFDQFQHYPVMAWKKREGGDKNHSYGVHFAQEARGKAIKAWTKNVLTPDLQRFLAGPTLFDDDLLLKANEAHESALTTLAQLHEMPVHDSAERSRIYREQLLGAPAWQRLKSAMDLWCACWFWPSDQLESAPLPSSLSTPTNETIRVTEEVANSKRFFHWELEFPDVFSVSNSGFAAMLGNPPWETLQPASKEFFSNLDPLFRTYGKQDALGQQTALFENAAVERDWLDYSSSFADFGNYMKYAAIPFGDPDAADDAGDQYPISRGGENALLHERWRSVRKRTSGYASTEHPFKHRGEGKAYTYKLFLEQGHALLRDGGRMGFIVPSGLYSDHGTRALRTLFLDRCSWEWLFGFENREKIFDIHRSFKFNPVIIAKGGRTEVIRTAFMRRSFSEWENAEQIATPYTRDQVERFSPRSRSILEVESARDLEILEKIYANSVLLGDEGPDSWGVKYAQGDFNMTSDSKLFPPRPKWEAQGYRPDEYSRWLKGNWRPIAELWPELGIDPTHVVPAEIELDDWLFDSSAGPDERISKAQFIHGHLLKPGDVQRTEWRVRCAQPPYDTLPISRADIPAGVVLSREADAWIRVDEIEDTALPLYEGRMIGQFDVSEKGWVSGKGRGAKWREIPFDSKTAEPQYCMSAERFLSETDKKGNLKAIRGSKVSFMDITSSTNARTMIASMVHDRPCGNSAPILAVQEPWSLIFLLNSIAFDYVTRKRCGGLHLNWFVIEDSAIPRRSKLRGSIGTLAKRLTAVSKEFAPAWVNTEPEGQELSTSVALTQSERVRLSVICDAISFQLNGLNSADVRFVLKGCANPTLPNSNAAEDVKGFWRIDDDLAPEARRTVLALRALLALEDEIRAANGNSEEGIQHFLALNSGDGWLIPETAGESVLMLNPDCGSDAGARVATVLGARFLDWQLSQTSEAFLAECKVHVKNLLGYAPLAQSVETNGQSHGDNSSSKTGKSRVAEKPQQTSFFS